MPQEQSEDVMMAIELRVPRRPEAARTARRTLEALRDRLPEERFSDLRLLVTELIGNSVVHAGPEAGERVKLTVRFCEHGGVRAEVVDGGVAFSHTPAAGLPDDESGRGLQLVQRLADRWGIARNHENRVWFELETAR